MGTFFKTFLCCLLICLGFFVYKYLKSESYETDLEISSKNPVYAKYDKHDYKNESPAPQQKDPNDVTSDTEQKYEYICYFYSGTGKLIPVKREFRIKQSLENTVSMLLSGPTIIEARQGIYSEIPKNVDLISLQESSDTVIVNLTSAFGEGGGSQSIENRVKQLSKTVKNMAKNKKVYLYIDNKEVEYLGGEGIYISQPLK